MLLSTGLGGHRGHARVIGTGRTRVVLDLKPGIYTYLCSTGGYWRTQHGTLVVR